MDNFVAIDFETANRESTSVCSVGIVIVQGGAIANSLYHLIRPAPDYYSYWNTRVHGLTHRDTATALAFPEVWSLIEPYLQGLPLVAHNSPFDQGCLRAVHRYYGMPYPDYQFYCTCRAARKQFPHLPNHKLDTVAAHCGYELLNHHNALADAEACAVIGMRVL